MDVALVVLLRPFLYLFLYVVAVYWIAKLIFRLLPPGKLRDFLFRRW